MLRSCPRPPSLPLQLQTRPPTPNPWGIRSRNLLVTQKPRYPEFFKTGLHNLSPSPSPELDFLWRKRVQLSWSEWQLISWDVLASYLTRTQATQHGYQDGSIDDSW